MDDSDHLSDSLARSLSSASAFSMAASDLSFDSQPSAASTSMSPARWLVEGPMPARGEAVHADGPEHTSDIALLASASSRAPEAGDELAKRWRRIGRLEPAFAGQDEGAVNLSNDGDGDRRSTAPEDCDFGARRHARNLPQSTAALSSSPASPVICIGALTQERAVEEEPAPTFPLGTPAIKLFLCRDHQDDLVPPCFYPGQAIPTLVVLELPRYTCLPHRLHLALNISLVGTLRCPPVLIGEERGGNDEWVERTFICTSVGLQEGLDVWRKDATTAWERLSARRKKGRSNPAEALPGGRYSLPLTVQVPSTPTLPPTFDLSSSAFEISYHLTVSLSINDPLEDLAPDALPSRVVIGRSSAPFSLLPTTLPTLPPTLAPIPGLLNSPPRRTSLSIMAGTMWLDRLNDVFDPLKTGLGMPTARSAHEALPLSPSSAHSWSNSWSILPSIPTTTFSPSSVIPIDFLLEPPPSPLAGALPSGQLLVHAAVLRREFLHTSAAAPGAIYANEGLLSEEEIISASGRIDLAVLPSVRPALPRLDLPLGHDASWSKAYTTNLSVAPKVGSNDPHIHCASKFYLSLQLAFSPAATGCLPPTTNAYVLNDPVTIPAHLLSRTVVVPILIGSVGEPPGSHRRVWRELYLGRYADSAADGASDGRPQIIEGVSVDLDERWIVAPPSYEAALLIPQYAP